MQTEPNTLPELDEPPASTRTVLILGLVGVGLAVVALVVGLATGAPRQGFEYHSADGIRVVLSCVGLLIAGCAVSMRPRWYGGWLCAAAAGLICYGFGGSAPEGTEWQTAPPRDWFAGLPNSWDSVQLFFGVAGGIALLGAIWTRVPRKVGYTMALIVAAYHFSCILSAVTSPPPTPWVTDQYWARVARRYVQFAYMNNAYQFYSPDPGPACIIWACIEYKSTDPEGKKDCEWVTIVDRKNEFVDPLGLSYYRRLSITENISQPVPAGYSPVREEYDKVLARRQLAARDRIPRMFPPEDAFEYRLPNQLVTRQVLPSYARHIIYANRKPGKEVKSVKIYRIVHVLISLDQFRGHNERTGLNEPGMSPYDPLMYKAFFQGEYDADGRLLDPTDELLFWFIPIWRDRALPDGGLNSPEYYRNGGFKHYYSDFVSKHAGCERPQE